MKKDIRLSDAFYKRMVEFLETSRLDSKFDPKVINGNVTAPSPINYEIYDANEHFHGVIVTPDIFWNALLKTENKIGTIWFSSGLKK